MMNNNKNIEIVVELLKKHNINKVVISPGGTNIAIIKAIQDDSYFTCYSVVDERSAIYFAIGMYLQTGDIIATSCTSAQATRNYVPGLTEAFYKHVPILALSMEKHSRFVYQEYMQAPKQNSLPEDCVKKSYELPYVNTLDDFLHSARITNEAILDLTKGNPGPVQLCIPWIDFPIDEVPNRVKKIDRITPYEIFKIDLSNKRILIVIGEHRPFSKNEKDIIDQFSIKYNCAIYTNHLSNYSGARSINGNLTLSAMSYEIFEKELKPDVFITIGGQTGDYPLYKLLSKTKLEEVEHWRINLDGEIVDTYDKLSKVYQMNFECFSRHCSYSLPNIENEYYEKWKSFIDSNVTDIELPLSNAFCAQKLHTKLPPNSIIHFSILNSLRVWSLFELDSSISCFSNVGAFGIDGGMSTMIGQSVMTDQLCYLVIGDLSFYYDINSLGIRHIKSNVRILLINNNGGVEFKMHAENSEYTNKFIAAGNHFKNAFGWATTCGFEYISIKTKAEFELNLDKFTSISDKPIIMEVFVNDKDDSEAYNMLINANENLGLKDFLKKNVKKSLNKFIKN